MIIAYLALGLVTGIAAALTTFLAGHGLLLAFAAYVLGGMAGMGACVLWAIMPSNGDDSPAPQPVVQHS